MNESAHSPLQAILDRTGIGLWERDLLAGRIWWTPQFAALIDVSVDTPPSEAVWESRVHPEDLPRVRDRIAQAVQRGRDYEIEYRVVLRNQSIRWIESRGHMTRDAHGRATRFAGMSVDVTRRFDAETSLKESERRFRFLADAMPSFVWVLSPTGRPLYVNRHWHEFTGLDAVQSLSAEWLEKAIHPDDVNKLLPAWQTAVAHAQPLEAELRVLRNSDGTFRWIVGRIVPVRDDNGIPLCWVGTAADIDSQHRAREEAEEASHTKDRLLAMVSHELRTPLTPVLALAQLLESDVTLPAEAREAATTIRRNVELESRLIDDLLDFTRTNNNKMRFQPGPCDVHEQVAGAIAMLRSDAAAKRLRLDVGLNAFKSRAHADAARLQQVFLNLIGNAIKFTPAGGTIAVESSSDLSFITVVISDSGSGIRADDLESIFEPFRQVAQDGSGNAGGLGLGLSIARSLVLLHGGSLQAESAGIGLGSRFVVRLPLALLSDVAPPAPTMLPRGERSAGLTILLVEDHDDSSRAMRRILERDGHRVVHSRTMTEALRLAVGGKFDLLVSDISLPDGDGWQLMRVLRETSPIPGIAMSGFGTSADIEQSLRVGFSEHLSKPVSVDRLKATIGKLVRREE